MNIQAQQGHIKALDGLRGLAILLVLLFHLFNTHLGPLNFLAHIGWAGVDLFFVLSGFLITGILLDTKGKKNYLRNFFAKRILRIFPIYYLSLVVLLLGTYLIDWQHFETLKNHQLWYWTYTQIFLFAFEGFPKGLGVLNHFWSLAVEEHFYLFWPFLVWALDWKKLFFLSIGIVLVSLLLRFSNPHAPYAYVFTFCRMDALAIGAIAVISLRHFKEYLNKSLPIISLVSILCLALLFATHGCDLNSKAIITFGYTLIAIFFSCILLLCFDTQTIGKMMNAFFSNSLLRFLGKYSYGIYVWHWILYNILYISLLKEWTAGHELLRIPFSLFIIGVSVASYHLFEIHFLKFKKRFA